MDADEEGFPLLLSWWEAELSRATSRDVIRPKHGNKLVSQENNVFVAKMRCEHILKQISIHFYHISVTRRHQPIRKQEMKSWPFQTRWELQCSETSISRMEQFFDEILTKVSYNKFIPLTWNKMVTFNARFAVVTAVTLASGFSVLRGWCSVTIDACFLSLLFHSVLLVLSGTRDS